MSTKLLHPTFASGEDRNPDPLPVVDQLAKGLHPTFASGEDRNAAACEYLRGD